MRKDFEKLFSFIQPPEPSAALFDTIMARINIEQRLTVLRRRFIVFSIGLAGALTALFPAFKLMRTGFVESEFAKFFSLMFSDFSVVAMYWRDFGLKLLESLPAMEMAAFLVVMLVAAELLKFWSKNAKLYLFNNSSK